MTPDEVVDRKKDLNWCSKHQVVHSPKGSYWSCRFPNDKKRNELFKKNRKENPNVE